MKYILISLVLSVFFFGCKKEQYKKLLGGYFKYSINGVETKIENGSGLYTNTFSCELFGDSSVYINVAKSYEGAGFFIKATKIDDGTYIFNSLNKAYFTNPLDYKRYSTDNTHTGQVVMQKGTFQATSVLNTLQGNFSYQVIDTTSGNTLNITNGSFLMEITEK